MLVADTTLISYVTIEGDFTKGAMSLRKYDPEWAAPLWALGVYEHALALRPA